MNGKILAIVQSTNFMYGAGRSFQNTMNNLDVPFDLIVPKPLFGKIDIEKIKEKFGENLGEIYVRRLPYKRCFYGRRSIRWKGHIYISICNLLYYLTNRPLRKEFGNKYDTIYLNSIVLYPLINLFPNTVIHVRERIEGSVQSKEAIRRSLNKAREVVSISLDVQEELDKIGIEGEVLNNPFNMEAVCNVDIDIVKKEYGIEDEFVFAILGKVYKNRGVDFVTEAFDELKSDKAKLIIAGDLDTDIGPYIKDVAKKNKNIILAGEVEDVEKIYAISDCIVRGEDKLSVGRTVYEGLYSGCSVLLPSAEGQDSTSIIDGDMFSDKIHFYTQRNKTALKKVMLKLIKTNKKRDKIGMSNVMQYIEAFKKILERV